MLTQTTTASFKASLRGELIEPGDQGYESARKVYNAMIDRRPRLIARCMDVADVILSVNGKTVSSAAEAARELQKIASGRLAQLRVWRGDSEVFVPVKKE